MAKKKNPEPAPVPPATKVFADLDPDLGLQAEILSLLDFVRYRDAGLRVQFADWAPIDAKMRATDRSTSPARVLEAAAARLADGGGEGLGDEDRHAILCEYVDKLPAQPDLTLADFLDELFGFDAPAESEPAPAPEPAPPAAPPKRRAKADAPPESAPLFDRRVVYKTPKGVLVHGVVTAESLDTVDLLADRQDAVWSNVSKALVRLDDGPIVWALSRHEADLVAGMLRPGRGPLPDVVPGDAAFELARRVSRTVLCLISVVNSAPQPYIAAYALDESAPEHESSILFEHKPPRQLVGDYLFEVPGLGAIPARVVIDQDQP